MSEGKRTLYYMAESAPCRTVLAVLRMLNLEVELKSLNLFAKEQLSEDFIKVSTSLTLICHFLTHCWLDQPVPRGAHTGRARWLHSVGIASHRHLSGAKVPARVSTLPGR